MADGALKVGIYDKPSFGTTNPAKATVSVLPEEMESYYESANQIIDGCESIPTGGEFCFEFLEGPKITFFGIYGAQGRESEGVIAGAELLTYEAYLQFQNLPSVIEDMCEGCREEEEVHDPENFKTPVGA